jgi:hypothetical protein
VDALTPSSTRRRWTFWWTGRIGRRSLRFEAVDEVLEVAHEPRVVEVRLVAGERDDTAVAFDCLVVVAFGLVEPAKALVAVMDAGEAGQNIVSGLFCLVVFLGVERANTALAASSSW